MNAAIAWFARNRVAANLVFALILVGGLLTWPTVKREIFPEIDLDYVTVTVAYPGAAPAEVEEGICIKIEERVQSVEGIEEIRSTAAEGIGSVVIEVAWGADADWVLDEVKRRVDAIDTFPADAERPIIERLAARWHVVSVTVSGDADLVSLRHLAEGVRDDLTALPGVTQVELTNAPDYEISIEVSEEALRRHGLTFDAVADAVRRGSLDLPGGSIKARGGEIMLRTQGQAYRGADFERLVVLHRPDGTYVTLGDLAEVVDGFEDSDQTVEFDGRPALVLAVYRAAEENALHVARAVRNWVTEGRARMPEGVQLTIWDDDSLALQSRQTTLVHNGRDGFVLVLVLLALFLRLRVAFWIIVGVPLSFLGTVWLLPLLGVTINGVSLFAFIVVIGILVDDAIVIGESIFTRQQRVRDPERAAIAGAQEVAVPVAFGVLTTVAAFVPMLFVPGSMGKFMKPIPIIVIVSLMVSLFESLFILPAHLAHHPRGRAGGDEARGWLGRLQRRVGGGLETFVERRYRPFLERCLEWRALTLATAIATLLLAIGLVGGGWVRFTFFSTIEADYARAQVTMPEGAPVALTRAAVAELASAAKRVSRTLAEEQGAPVLTHVMGVVGTQSASGPVRFAQASNANLGEVRIELTPSEERDLPSAEIARRWRAETPPIPGAEFTYQSTMVSAGEPINIRIGAPDVETLRAATARLREALAAYPGVVDIRDTLAEGQQELRLRVRPSAEALGLTLSDLGRQVRQAFHGEEAQRIQRGRDDVRVMVRYPAAARRSLGDIETMRIRTPDGAAVPFATVAEVEHGRGPSSITRADRRRVVDVVADVDAHVTTANDVVAAVAADVMPGLVADFPGLTYDFAGEQARQSETLGALGRGFVVALFAIYALLAVPLRSYTQPFLVMTAIPFGVVGAVLGHLVCGWSMNMYSVVGLVALAGMVVNDSLVLVSTVNQRREGGLHLRDALLAAATTRFRPILLTSITTFAGLTPLMLERSVQAQFMIPMAISIAFGIVFSTVVTLLMLPATYLVLEDVRRVTARTASAVGTRARAD